MDTRWSRLLSVCRAHGNDAEDPRDAAHEMCHVFETEMTDWDDWRRDSIHRGVLLLDRKERGSRANLWLSELRARVVEETVCRELGFEIPKWDVRMMTAVREAMHYSLPYAIKDGHLLKVVKKQLLTKQAHDWIMSVANDEA